MESLKGLIELHEHGLIHADLKPDNLFYKGDKAKIADLGLSIPILIEESFAYALIK